MFILAHLAAGLLVGGLMRDYVAALLGALVLDLDHLISYVRHGLLRRPGRLWATVTQQRDPYGDQRNLLHNVAVWAMLCVIILVIDLRFGAVFAVASFSHLLLDILDGADFYPFYPLRLNIRGPVGYLSKAELLVTAILFGAWLVT